MCREENGFDLTDAMEDRVKEPYYSEEKQISQAASIHSECQAWIQ